MLHVFVKDSKIIAKVKIMGIIKKNDVTTHGKVTATKLDLDKHVMWCQL